MVNGTAAPATNPISTAPTGGTTAQPALIATSPPVQPLALSEKSGLPKRARVIRAAANAALPAPSVVFIAIRTAVPA